MDRDSWQRSLEATTQSGTAPRRDSSGPSLVGLTVLGHPDSSRVGEVAPLAGLLAGRAEHLSRLQPLFAPQGPGPPQPLGDPRLSRQPVRISALADEGIRLEADFSRVSLTVDGQPVAGKAADLPQSQVAAGTVLLLARRVALVLHPLETDPCSAPTYGLVGGGRAISNLRREIERVADLAFPVLLRGESGTGKELVARALHAASKRRQGPFLTVNLGAVPPNLAAAELFGSTKGAFTGADRSRRGYFQRAEGGSLFLDEIGEASKEVQKLLLRALDGGEIQPVGASRPQPVDVRWIAATDADLEAAAADGEFKTPLLHRLSGYDLRLPPLRQRREDIGRLLFHFLDLELAEVQEQAQGLSPEPGAPEPGERPRVSAQLLSRLALFSWPGNVRQLRNVVRQMVIAGRGSGELRATTAVEGLLSGPAATAREPGGPQAEVSRPVRRASGSYRDPDGVGRGELREALRASRWNLQRTARQLGISRGSLYELVDRDPSLGKASDLSRGDLERCLEECGGDLEAMVDRLQVSKRGLKLRLTELGLGRGQGT